MKIQYCSDLHLEFEKNNDYFKKHKLKTVGDVLILAGDIIPMIQESMNNDFFNYISDHYEMAFWIPGNHEYYYNNINFHIKELNTEIRKNIKLVNNSVIEYHDIKFIFTTLWSKISQKNEKLIEERVADFDLISVDGKKLNAQSFNKLHHESLKLLESNAGIGNKKVVVVTHHVPSRLCNIDIHNKSEINEAFCVDITHFIEKSNVNFWIYGHNHFNQKPIYIGKTILLTNQMGYMHLNEDMNYRNDAFFSI